MTKLTICPTPIGHLEDLTPRQRRALEQADVIACEDTRTTGKLLELLGIVRHEGRPALTSYHDHNAATRAPELVARMHQGQRVTLVCDAGTPTVSDPGYRLVQAAREAGLPVEALPGPVAAIVALSGSGLPSDRFFFEGFLPTKAAARAGRLAVLLGLEVTVVCYESPHRLLKALEAVKAVAGPDHLVVVARELTKVHEEYVRGPVATVLEELAARPKVRGECVLLLAPGSASVQTLDHEALIKEITQRLDHGQRTRAIRDDLLGVSGLGGSDLYRLIESLKA